MKSWLLFAGTLIMRAIVLPILLGLLLAPSLRANDAFPTDAKFVIQLNVAEFAATGLGGKLVKLTQTMASEQLGASEEKFVETLEETLGFDPTIEIQTLTLLGTSYDSPEEDLRLVVQMQQTTGNLEGFLLGLPGYSSHEIDEMTIHAFDADGSTVHLAIHDLENGSKRLLAAMSESQLMDLLHSSQSTDAEEASENVWVLPPPVFAHVDFRQLPDDLVHGLEGAENVAKLIQGLQLSISEADDAFDIELKLSTESTKKAEQIQQLLQGLKAMAGLFQEELKKQDEAAAVALELLEDVTMEHQDQAVLIHALVPEEWILTFLRDEADLPL